MAKRKPKRTKSAEQLQLEAAERKRVKLIEMGRETGGGVPEQQVDGARVYDFEEHGKTIRKLYPAVLDRWFAEGKISGDPSFQDPQRAALEHCRGLWAKLGTQRLCANYLGVGGGDGDEEGYLGALKQIAEYQKDIPVAYWRSFENVARFDMPAGEAGSHLARTTAQQQAHAKAATGMCLSLIAMWRGY